MNQLKEFSERHWLLMLFLLSFPMGILIIYEKDVHPLFGFLSGLLFAWLSLEDWLHRLIDIRVAALLMLLGILCSETPGYTFLTILGFGFVFEGARHALAGFSKDGNGTAQTEMDDPCPLKDEMAPGFMPFLFISCGILLFVDMMVYPIGILHEIATQNLHFSIGLFVHEGALHVGNFMASNLAVPAGLASCAFLFMLVLRGRTARRLEQGFSVQYPMGDGDPFLLAGLAGLLGAEILWFAVLPFALIIGLAYRFFESFRTHSAPCI